MKLPFHCKAPFFHGARDGITAGPMEATYWIALKMNPRIQKATFFLAEDTKDDLLPCDLPRPLLFVLVTSPDPSSSSL